MATAAGRPKFRISREAAFWILVAAAMIAIGIVLDVFWGSF